MQNKLEIKKMRQYASVILHHKWEVFKCCHMAGITWQGIKHDLSKFSPTEFLSASRYFIKGSSPVGNQREILGYSEAWQHHKGHNPHHWEYWTHAYRPNQTTAIKVPFKYVMEMFCDYMGAGRVYGANGGTPWTPESAQEYWINMRDNKSCIHPETAAIITLWYEILVEYGLEATLKSLHSYEQEYNDGKFI